MVHFVALSVSVAVLFVTTEAHRIIYGPCSQNLIICPDGCEISSTVVSSDIECDNLCVADISCEFFTYHASTGGCQLKSHVGVGPFDSLERTTVAGYLSGGPGCTAETSINGAWTTWSTWSICSISCRERTCENPAPAGSGDDCPAAPTFELQGGGSNPPREDYSREPCDNTVRTASSGMITSSMGATTYFNNLDCGFLISVPDATSITLTFSFFNLEDCCSCDYVAVFDGPSADSPRIGDYLCDADEDELTWVPSPVTSTSGAMFILLHTDGGWVREGFSATYTASFA